MKKILITLLTLVLLILLVIGASYFSFIQANGEYAIDEKNIIIPIFVYHDIVKEMTGEEYMQTTEKNFREQMIGLQNLGYQIIRYDDLIAYQKGEKKLNEKSILVTFDDGRVGNYEVLFPIIKELNIPITINIVDNNVGTKGAMTWEQIKEMSDSRTSRHLHS